MGLTYLLDVLYQATYYQPVDKIKSILSNNKLNYGVEWSIDMKKI